VTFWQHATGVKLDDVDAPDFAAIGDPVASERDPVDIARAMLVGCLLLVELFLRRHPRLDTDPTVGLGVSAADARLVGRWVSRLWDESGDPDRPGRWTPDPAANHLLGVSAARHSPVDALMTWRRLLVAVEGLLGLGPVRNSDGVPVLDLSRPHPARVIEQATTPARGPGIVVGIGLADTLDVLAELHRLIDTTTHQLLARDSETVAHLTDADAPVVLAVAASAMRLSIALLGC
jgi:hypothetical protein